jgi:hypothetical protein
MSADPDRLLGIYLNDHLAGATGGVELARRLRGSASGEEAAPIARLCGEIEADRATLERVMDELGIGRQRLKPAGAWLAEKLGRLKLNGRLFGHSPLSRVVELEVLHLGVTGKMQLWQTLARTVGGRPLDVDFERLAKRAAGQREAIDELHLAASKRCFPAAAESPFARSGSGSEG